MIEQWNKAIDDMEENGDTKQPIKTTLSDSYALCKHIINGDLYFPEEERYKDFLEDKKDSLILRQSGIEEKLMNYINYMKDDSHTLQEKENKKQEMTTMFFSLFNNIDKSKLIVRGYETTRDEKNKVKDKIGVYEDSEGMALQPDIGDHEEGEGSPVPEGTNSGRTGEPHDSDQEEGLDGEGNKDIMKIAQLSGMSYRYFVTDKKNRKYVISFTSLYDEENCDLEMSHLDDGGNKYKTEITNCSINGSEGYIENGIIKGFELKNGVKYKIEVDTDLDDYYACEVKIYANR